MNNNDAVIQALPSVQEMVSNGYTVKHWLQFFINIWTRQATACAIDIKCDQVRKAIDPEMMVEDQQQIIPVKQRLENRKLKMQDYLDIIAGAKELMAIPDDQIDEALFSEKALAVDADMVELPVKTDEDVENQGEPVANFKVVKEGGIEIDGTKYEKDALISELDLGTEYRDALLESGDIIVE